MKSLSIFTIFVLFPLMLASQRDCGSHEIFQEQMESDPTFRAFQKATAKNITQRSPVNGVITIPVVVHVIYNTPAENISDEQIYSQLQVLNEDFRRINSDKDNLWPQATDTEFEFCLATRDQYGDATCGITRTYSDTTKWRLKTTMKSDATGGKTGWPADQYLNMWVCDLSGLLGFATFPGSSLDIDGVVTDTRAFGNIGDLKPDFALGRTTTHEIGHWMNLRHIWGDGDCTYDDFVSDTPLSDDHNYGCDIGHISCGTVDMVQNYMDYSDDVCMNLFTLGQKNRMRALFEPGGFRESLLDSEGCSAPLECNTIFLTLNMDDHPEDLSWRIENEQNEVVAQVPSYTSSVANTTFNYSVCVPDGNYDFIINDSYGDGMCCDEGPGSYQLYTTYATIKDSNGQFGAGESVAFTVEDSKYRFVGPGPDWNDPNNWNKLDPPSECYEGEIIIDSDCEVEFSNDLINDVRIRNAATLTCK